MQRSCANLYCAVVAGSLGVKYGGGRLQVVEVDQRSAESAVVTHHVDGVADNLCRGVIRSEPDDLARSRIGHLLGSLCSLVRFIRLDAQNGQDDRCGDNAEDEERVLAKILHCKPFGWVLVDEYGCTIDRAYYYSIKTKNKQYLTVPEMRTTPVK